MVVERRRRRWLSVCGRSAQRNNFPLEGGLAGITVTRNAHCWYVPNHRMDTPSQRMPPVMGRARKRERATPSHPGAAPAPARREHPGIGGKLAAIAGSRGGDTERGRVGRDASAGGGEEHERRRSGPFRESPVCGERGVVAAPLRRTGWSCPASSQFSASEKV